MDTSTVSVASVSGWPTHHAAAPAGIGALVMHAVEEFEQTSVMHEPMRPVKPGVVQHHQQNQTFDEEANHSFDNPVAL